MIEIFKVDSDYICSWCDDKISPATLVDHASSHLDTLEALRNIANTTFTFEAKNKITNCYVCDENRDCAVCCPEDYEDDNV